MLVKSMFRTVKPLLPISFLIVERIEYRHTQARSHLKRQRGTRKTGKVEIKIKSENGQ